MTAIANILWLALASCSAQPLGHYNELVTANEEFGFSIKFPAGIPVCIASSASHPHGFFAHLSGNCNRPHSKNVRSLSIWASYNAAEWDMADLERVYCARPRHYDDLVAAIPSVAKLPSRHCLTRNRFGMLVLHVLALRGSDSISSEDVPASSVVVNYRVTMITTPEDFGEDYQVFQRFVNSIELR